MKTKATFLAIVLATISTVGESVDYPSPADYHDRVSAMGRSSGFLMVDNGGSRYRGSATVVRENYLLYSAAHVMKAGGWAKPEDVTFYPEHHGSSNPSGGGYNPRGYLYYTGYSGGSSAYDFQWDFSVSYRKRYWGTSPTPAYRPEDVQELVSSSNQKAIFGYPAQIDYTGGGGGAWLHKTGEFDHSFFEVYRSYYGAYGVSTGPGNSGGGLFVQNSSGEWGYAGILVSGNSVFAGVRNSDYTLEYFARNADSERWNFRTFNAVYNGKIDIPDNSENWSVANLYSGKAQSDESIKRVYVTLNIQTPNRNELDVVLRSPSGRMITLFKGNMDDEPEENLVFNSGSFSYLFYNTDARGMWSLYMRDTVPGNDAKLSFFRLEFSALN